MRLVLLVPLFIAVLAFRECLRCQPASGSKVRYGNSDGSGERQEISDIPAYSNEEM